jgi:hypothetical protein
VPYSNETLYMKTLEYKTYFTHIDSEQILKNLRGVSTNKTIIYLIAMQTYKELKFWRV